MRKLYYTFLYRSFLSFFYDFLFSTINVITCFHNQESKGISISLPRFQFVKITTMHNLTEYFLYNLILDDYNHGNQKIL